MPFPVPPWAGFLERSHGPRVHGGDDTRHLFPAYRVACKMVSWECFSKAFMEQRPLHPLHPLRRYAAHFGLVQVSPARRGSLYKLRPLILRGNHSPAFLLVGKDRIECYSVSDARRNRVQEPLGKPLCNRPTSECPERSDTSRIHPVKLLSGGPGSWERGVIAQSTQFPGKMGRGREKSANRGMCGGSD
jgi:hypothetical protein